MNWYSVTCYRCRGQFLDTAPDSYCVHCAAPSIGIRNDGQLVRHDARPVAPPPEPALPPLPRSQSMAAWASLDENGELRICHWRLTSSTTGKRYTTRRKLSEVTAKGMDPNAQPVGDPEIIHATGETNTSICMGHTPSPASADVSVVPAPAGTVPGWRNGEEHQWSRDPGRSQRRGSGLV